MTTTLKPNITDLFAHPPQKQYQGIAAQSLYLTMRDDTQIAIDVLLPANLPPDTRLPVIMVMARYWRSMELRVPAQPGKAPIGPREPITEFLIPRGFAMVMVDARGTGASLGVNRTPFAPEEILDYGEIAAWVLQQSWCSGSIGAIGISYEGATAARLPATGITGIKAVVPQEIEFDIYTDIAMPGGVFNAAFINAWSDSNTRLDNNQTSSLFPWLARPLIKGVRPVDADRTSRTLLKQAIQAHQANTNVHEALSNIVFRDDMFGSTGLIMDDFSVQAHRAGIEKSEAAYFSWGSWLDGASAESALKTYNTFPNPQIAIIGTWKHEMTRHGSPFQKPNAQPNPLHEQQWAAVAQFFEQTLKQEQPPKGKTLFYYTMGAEAWQQTDTFPLPNTEIQTWYFQNNHGLAPELPSDGHAVDTYTVNFNATTGVTNRWNTQMAQPVIYRDRAKEDEKLLTYTSEPFATPVEITGYPVVTLHIACTTEDCAFFVYLEDVDATGVVRYITEGQLRAVHRQLSPVTPNYWTGMPQRSYLRADAALLPKDKFVEIVIGLQPTSVLIQRGHRIRVAIAGADKDTFARIPAQAIPTWQVARSTITASHIQLPYIRHD